LVGALAATQTVGYGVLYYAFAVFLTPMVADLQTTPTAVTGALTLAVLVTAAAAIPVGRFLDRRGGRGLMSAGSTLGTVAVLGWSQVHSVAALYGVFAVMGLASAMVFYEPAFAVIVAHFDARSRSHTLLAVTVVAGFSSSIFLPLAGLLNAHLGWRGALVALAAIHATITIPLHWFVLPRAAPRSRAPARRSASDRTAVVRAALGTRPFWLLVVAFVAQTAAIATIAVHLVTYLSTLGHTATFAAAIAGLLGILSVTGRLVTTGLYRRLATTTVTAATFALQGIAIAALPAVGRAATGAIACVVLFGLGFGVGTIARPILLAERYGTTAYASLAGTLALPVTLGKAAAPMAAAILVTTTGGYTPVMAAVAAACLLAAALLLLTQHQPRRGQR
jgi:predicted MFS family arabinose efflux permease